MQQDELSPFGNYLKGRLKELGKTNAWLLKRLRQEGSFMNEEQLCSVYNGTNQSRPRQAMIGKIIRAEEERQRLKRVAGIGKRGLYDKGNQSAGKNNRTRQREKDSNT